MAKSALLGEISLDKPFSCRITVLTKVLAKNILDLPTVKFLYQLIIESRENFGIVKNLAALQVLLDLGSLSNSSSFVKRRILHDLKSLFPDGIGKLRSLTGWYNYLLQFPGKDERVLEETIDVISHVIVISMESDRRAWKDFQTRLHGFC